MMIPFCETGSIAQIFLLIISQFTVISLVCSIVILFKHKCKTRKLISLCILLLVNTTTYVVMQLDSRITADEQSPHLHVPYVLFLLVVLLSLAFTLWVILSETKNRKSLNHTSIKESFDTLPTGVCFFNEVGLPVLCNPAMQRFSFAVCGKDVQFITDLEVCLEDDFVTSERVKKEGNVFALNNGKAWRLEKRSFEYDGGNIYTQYIATDVSELYENGVELKKENEHLRKVQSDLQKLSANVVAATREEEILNTKMRVHDEMGRCLIEARKYLKDENTDKIPQSVVDSWQKAVSMLKYNNDTSDEDMLSQIFKTCESVNLRFIQRGNLPKEEDAAYILTCAVRECVTNAVRYADASELCAEFTVTETISTVVVTNNGTPPEKEIVEGGGLSTLRRRVERSGGFMYVESFPEFKLIVTVPNKKEGLL